MLMSTLDQGKAKKRAWQKVVDEGLTVDEAKERYVKLVALMKEKYGYDADKVPEAVGGTSQKVGRMISVHDTHIGSGDSLVNLEA